MSLGDPTGRNLGSSARRGREVCFRADSIEEGVVALVTDPVGFGVSELE